MKSEISHLVNGTYYCSFSNVVAYGVSVLGAENLGKTQTLARMIGVEIIPSALGICTLVPKVILQRMEQITF